MQCFVPWIDYTAEKRERNLKKPAASRQKARSDQYLSRLPLARVEGTICYASRGQNDCREEWTEEELP